MIEIYADGAYNAALDTGGWAAVIIEADQRRILSGKVEHTTSNRMEITAALQGISHTPENAEVVVYTDSQYLFGCMTKRWKRLKNIDLLSELDQAVSKHKVRWKWVSGDAEDSFHLEAHTRANFLTGLDEKAYSSQTEAKNTPTPELTHLDAAGRPKMVDIGEKPDTERQAIAKGIVKMQPTTFSLIKQGKVAKGDVLTTAQLAGIMAAKKAPDLIPLCHPILITSAKVELKMIEADSAIEITATVDSIGKTGVEMEALTAVAVAALTIYDMCKAIDRGMRMENIRLIRKSGGKSGTIGLE